MDNPWVDIVCDVHEISKHVPPDTYDGALLFHILEHLENPLKALREVYKVVKYFIMIKVPNARYVLSGESHDHIYSWNEYTLSNLLNRAGFKRIKIYESTRYTRNPGPLKKIRIYLSEFMRGHKNELTAFAWKRP